ncbi:MAG: dTDP-4-dehydrorhamnose 3,5-epimerase [Flavobacteriaceae bacterium]
MQTRTFDIEGPVLVVPPRFGDARGWLSPVWTRGECEAAIGRPFAAMQENHAYTAGRGTLRGLHFQRPPHMQAKLVRCLSGRVLDVAVDIREGSPAYGRHVAAELTAERGEQLFVPRGFAHGYLTLEADCEVAYLLDGAYSPEHEAGLLWSDPALAIGWPQAGSITVNARDAAYPALKDLRPLPAEGAAP